MSARMGPLLPSFWPATSGARKRAMLVRAAILVGVASVLAIPVVRGQGGGGGIPTNTKCQLGTSKSILCDAQNQGNSYCGSHHGSACTYCRGGVITGQAMKCVVYDDATCSQPPNPPNCSACPGTKNVGQCLDNGSGTWTCQNPVESGACGFEVCDACTYQP